MTTWTDDEVGGSVWSEDEAAGTALGAATGSSLVGFVQSGTGATARTAEAKMREIVTPEDLGAIGDLSDDTTALGNFFARSSDTLHVKNTYRFSSLSLANDVTCMGDGYVIGTAVSGSKPTRAELTGAASAAARLTDLETYYTGVITLTGTRTIRGNLELRDCLIKSSAGATLKVEGHLILNNVSFHKVSLQAIGRGYIDATGLLVTDSPSTGLYATRGATIYAPSAGITHSASRGVMVQNAGMIDVTSGEIYNSTQEGIYCIFGGTIIATSAKSNAGSTDGVGCFYGGSIDISGGQVSDNASDGIVCESNGAVYADSTTINSNDAIGITTVRGGVINAGSATITNSGSYACYANGGGYIDILLATVDNTNTGSGGQILRAIGNGLIRSEAPVTGSGKTTLTAAHYYPGFNTVGNGVGYIGLFAANSAIISLGGVKAPATSGKTIASGAITATDFYQVVDTESAAATDDLDTITHDQVDVVLIRQASDTRDITVKHNTGNIKLNTGADKVFVNRNGLIMLVWNPNTSLWIEPGTLS